ncbi:hypothetical protein BLI708_10295 [Bifidobacterium imperatoris]|uniref:Uncharacterized protein n=2 Tax=Bifidobacterium imperatoris TaxID=2020965 RepID=A0A2N5IP78_9BIFI|nr:hypothetical protein [Bifidobacterium imperatoris]PLS23767.1 hypothetical protein Tam1G_2174 [Bifidobacterium imperatoris]QSY57583.1 hypothetical protein BLI708_10295 [Bifidobacterium imperatoris]
MNDKTAPFKLVCLICGKSLTAEVCINHHIGKVDYLPLNHDDNDLLPMGAIEMTSYGHYGTTFFDPCDDGTQVAALICDECMEERSSRLLYINKQRQLKPFDTAMKELEERWKAEKAEREANPVAPLFLPEEQPVDEDGYPIINEEFFRTMLSEKPSTDN